VRAQTTGLEQGLKLAERYQVAELLSEGGLCAVYRGQDLVLRRPIVVKVAPPPHVESYRAALRLTSSFAHPAVVCLYDMIEQDGSLFLIQEYVAARSLDHYLETSLPIERAIDIARQIAFALSYAHAKGVVHGDLTPAAVLIDRHAIVRLNNFCAPPDQRYFTRIVDAVAHDIGGDQEQNVAAVGEAGDVAALGYLLWLMVTEPAAPAGDSPDWLLRSTRADIPESLSALLRRIIHTDTALSAPRASELAIELERLSSAYAASRTLAPVETPAAIRAYRALADSTGWANEQTVASGRSALEQVARSAPGPMRGGTQVFLPGTEGAQQGLVEPAFGVAPRLRLPTRPPSEGASLRAAISTYEDAAEALSAPPDELENGGVPLMPLLLLGAVLFVLFFLVGFYSFAFGR
jgi:eukaryotic-like serine/threonine-protein kinase